MEEKQWGSWIRASPRKGRIKLQEEAKTFLRSSRSLTFNVDKHGRSSMENNMGGGSGAGEGKEGREELAWR